MLWRRRVEALSLAWNQVAFFFLIGSAIVIVMLGLLDLAFPLWGVPRPPGKLLGFLLFCDCAALWAAMAETKGDIPYQTLLPLLASIVIHASGDMAMR